MIPAALAEAVAALVRRPQILVGLDFDGVLAPIVEEREAARALPGTMDAVCELARCDGVHVALVSGRALESLGHVSGLSAEDPLTLVGSHGAELRLHGERPGPDVQARPTSAQRDLLDRVIDALEEIAGPDGSPAALEVEVKPSAAVLHTRRAPDEVARRAEAAALAGPGSWTGVHAIRGKAVVELSVLDTSKGLALQRLRSLLEVESILYAGDDVTDETAFAALGPDDVAVKVGPGATRAAYRLDGPEDVRELLRLLLQLVVAERSQR